MMKVTVVLEKLAPLELEIGSPESTVELWSCVSVETKEISDEIVANEVYQSLRAKLKGEKTDGI